MTELDKILNQCSSCRYCHEQEVSGDPDPHWICTANPPIWNGTDDPLRHDSWIYPQILPDSKRCRFFEDEFGDHA